MLNMVEVRFKLTKRDFVWMGLIVVLLGVGFTYGYGTDNPAVFGHSFGELSDCGENEYLRGDGGCANASYIVTEGGGSSANCTVTTWVPATNTVCSGVSFEQLSNCGDSRTVTGTASCPTCSCGVCGSYRSMDECGCTINYICTTSGWQYVSGPLGCCSH